MSGRVAGGALWMVLFKVLERTMSFVATLALARLLLPQDFGIVAMGTSLLAFTELFSAFGVETALIQRRNITPSHYHTAWTLNVIMGLLVAVFMCLAAVPAALFYREPDLDLVMVALGINAALQGTENVGVVDFRRNLQFDREFRYMLTKKALSFLVTIPFAFALQNYWALVFGILGSRVLVVANSYRVHPLRPRFSLATSRELLNFSKWIVGLNLLTFLRDRPAGFILGRTRGSHVLGTFTLAAELASIPSTEMVAPINRALLPSYVRLADDPAALARQYLAAMGVIALIAIPAVAGLAATAPYVVLLLLGPEWLDAIPVLQVLAFFGVVQVLQTNAYSAFLAVGKPSVFLYINAFHVTVLLILLFILVPSQGMMGAAWAYALSGLAALPVNFLVISRFMLIPVSSLVRAVWRPMVCATVMYFLVRLMLAGWPLGHGSIDALLPLGLGVSGGVLAYSSLVFMLWQMADRPAGAELWILTQMTTLYRRVRGKDAPV